MFVRLAERAARGAAVCFVAALVHLYIVLGNRPAVSIMCLPTATEDGRPAYLALAVIISEARRAITGVH